MFFLLIFGKFESTTVEKNFRANGRRSRQNIFLNFQRTFIFLQNEKMEQQNNNNDNNNNNNAQTTISPSNQFYPAQECVGNAIYQLLLDKIKKQYFLSLKCLIMVKKEKN